MHKIVLLVLISMGLMMLSMTPVMAATMSDPNFYATYDCPAYYQNPSESGLFTWAEYTVEQPATFYVNDSGSVTQSAAYGYHMPLYIASLDFNAVTTDTVTMNDGTMHTITITTRSLGVWPIYYGDGITIQIDGGNTTYYEQYLGRHGAAYIDIFIPKQNSSEATGSPGLMGGIYGTLTEIAGDVTGTPQYQDLGFYELIGATRDPLTASISNFGGSEGCAANTSTGTYIVKHVITSTASDNNYAFYQFNISQVTAGVEQVSTPSVPNDIVSQTLSAFGALGSVIGFGVSLIWTFISVIVMNWTLWVGLFEAFAMLMSWRNGRDIFSKIRLFVEYNVSAFNAVVRMASVLGSIFYYIVVTTVDLVKWW